MFDDVSEMDVGRGRDGYRQHISTEKQTGHLARHHECVIKRDATRSFRNVRSTSRTAQMQSRARSRLIVIEMWEAGFCIQVYAVWAKKSQMTKYLVQQGFPVFLLRQAHTAGGAP